MCDAENRCSCANIPIALIFRHDLETCIIGHMPTSKNGSKQRSKRNKMSPVVLAVVFVVVGYFGFRWIRGLMMLGYADSAIVRMRGLHAAEVQFAQAHPTVGYTCALLQLPPNGEVQRLLTGNGIDNGYAFEIAGCQAPDARRPNSAYYTSARPLHPGQPAFCSDESGTLKAEYSGSVEKCRANGLPL